MYDLESLSVRELDALEMVTVDGGGLIDWISGKYKEYTQNPPMEQAQNI